MAVIDLRKQANQDMAFTLEGELGLPVELVAPDGKVYNTNKLTGETLKGQILYDTAQESPADGSAIYVNEPVVTLNRLSLWRVPKAGETWAVRIPIVPDADAPKQSFQISSDRPPSGGGSLGFIRIYLTRDGQS